MRKLLQNIYRKPKAVRDTYAIGIAGVFTAIVCVFWVTAKLQTPIDGGSLVRDNVSPFATLINKSKEQMAAIRGAMPADPTTTEEPVTATSTSANSATTLILSEEDRAAAASKASTTATTTTEVQYKEVLIGTTTATTTRE